jgi:hypothetical protein
MTEVTVTLLPSGSSREAGSKIIIYAYVSDGLFEPQAALQAF